MSQDGHANRLVKHVAISQEEEDRFGRVPWAKRVAHTIEAQIDPASLVVAVYGPWGDGKTSALNFIVRELERRDSALIVRFNPWQLGIEAELFSNFFSILATAVDRDLATRGVRIGKALATYGSLFELVPVVGKQLASVAQAGGNSMATQTLEEQRLIIEGELAKVGKRIVIVMDDIDRLDKSEVQALFRLIKVSADFDNTAYLLAFDESVVTAALAERYAGTSTHGSDFMEKIVQLPLHLPPAGADRLRQMAVQAVDYSLGQAGVELTAEERTRFDEAFYAGVVPALRTPRAVNKFDNALRFALPMLASEVDVPDLLLIEAMRAYFPEMYKWVRDHEALVIGPHYPVVAGRPREWLRLREAVKEGLSKVSSPWERQAESLLRDLFPVVANILQEEDDPGRVTGRNTAFADDRRISSSHYFRRYFTYALQDADASEQDIADTLAVLNDEPEPVSDVYATLMQRVSAESGARFVELLLEQCTLLRAQGGLEERTTQRLIRLLALAAEEAKAEPTIAGVLSMRDVVCAAAVQLLGYLRLPQAEELVAELREEPSTRRCSAALAEQVKRLRPTS